MQGCNQKLPLCNCVDWKKDDLVLQVNHLMTHFEFSRFELEYNPLEREETRRLCKIGRCRTCGQRLCIGTKLAPQNTVSGLLEEIYHWMYRMWDGPHGPLTGFREAFLALFRESDQEEVVNWLDRRYPLTKEGG